MQRSWTLMSIRMNHPFHGGKSLPARQEDSNSKFCLGRTCITITMKFLNEVVNGGVTIILFGVTNAVCVPKKRNFSFLGVSRGRGNT